MICSLLITTNRLRSMSSKSNKHLLLEWPSQWQPTESVLDGLACSSCWLGNILSERLGLTRASHPRREGRSTAVGLLGPPYHSGAIGRTDADARQESDSCVPKFDIGAMPFTKGCLHRASSFRSLMGILLSRLRVISTLLVSCGVLRIEVVAHFRVTYIVQLVFSSDARASRAGVIKSPRSSKSTTLTSWYFLVDIHYL